MGHFKMFYRLLSLTFERECWQEDKVNITNLGIWSEVSSESTVEINQNFKCFYTVSCNIKCSKHSELTQLPDQMFVKTVVVWSNPRHNKYHEC